MPRDAIERFWMKVEMGPGCWLWLGAKRGKGYGSFFVDGRNVGAHRYAYELANGPIPVGLQIDHLCRTPLCVRADHLEVVTSRINTLRGVSVVAKCAVATHCPHGHEYTPENTYRSRGERACKTCRNAQGAQYYRQNPQPTIERMRRYRAQKRRITEQEGAQQR